MSAPVTDAAVDLLTAASKARLAERKAIVTFIRWRAELAPSIASALQSIALQIECEDHKALASLSEEHADTDDLGRGWPQ